MVARFNVKILVIDNYQAILNRLNLLEVKFAKLQNKCDLLERENKELKAKLKLRDERIRVLENKLTSKNSSIPPSKDISKSSRNLSLRKTSGRKSGGQKGHKGHTLEMKESADVILDHYVIICDSCNENMTNSNQRQIDKKQVFDIVPSSLIVTEHRKYQASCPNCHHVQQSRYPIPLSKSKTMYGSFLSSFVSYLSARQYLPIARIQELIKLMYGQQLSEGTIVNMIKKQANQLGQVHDQIRQAIQSSKLIGSDETGCSINGKTHWVWVFQNYTYTYLNVSTSRGFKTIENLFPEGFKNSVLVSDRWPAQLKIKTKEKQICLAHLLRDCNKLIDHHGSRWAMEMKKIIEDIFQLAKEKRISPNQKSQIEERLYNLFSSPLTKSKKEIRTFQKSLASKWRHITTCLYERYVPPDNNGSERAIRNVKVKEKVSGGFRSFQGAQQYAIIRSIIDTARKRGMHPFLVLQNPHSLFLIAE